MYNNLMKEKHIAVVDDHFAIRVGLETILNTIPYIKKVSLFESGYDFLAFVKYHQVDAAFFDIKMGTENGLELCKSVRKKDEKIKIIIFSAYDEIQHTIRAQQYGADGYILKCGGIDELKLALDEILFKEQKYFSRAITDKILDHELRIKGFTYKPKEILSNREMEILRYLCEGLSNKEIATRINREESSVAKHRSNMMKKIGAHKTVDLINYAIKYGLYEPQKF